MGKCPHGKKSVPVNKKLYATVKQKVKTRSKVWPSAYASGQLVREYKSKGGKYKCKFGSLDRWFKEKWVNVCKRDIHGNYRKCGRSKSSRKGYPYCRPSKRVNKHTPKTVRELSRSTLKKMCGRKQKNPYKKLGKVSSGKKNNFGSYIMNKDLQSCGIGRRRFGGLLGNITKASKLIKKQGNTLTKNIKKGKEAYNKNKEAINELKNTSKEAYNNIKQAVCPDGQKFDMELQKCVSLNNPRFGGLLGAITKASSLVKKHGNTVTKNIKKGKETYNKNKEAIKELKQTSKEAYNNVKQAVCPDGEKFDMELQKCVNINSFGYNLGPTSSNLDVFYKNGTANSLNYTKSASGCMSNFYNAPVSRFGKKSKNFIQEANRRSRRKGTVGSFTRWCKRHGHSKVTTACINKGKKSKSLKTRRRAIFAQNIRSKKKRYTFGESGCKRQPVSFGKSKKIKSINADIVYLKK
jgi:gas vesicle protein